MKIDQLVLIAIVMAGLIFVFLALIRTRSGKSSTSNTASKDTPYSEKEPSLNANTVVEPTESSVEAHVNQNSRAVKKSMLNEEIFHNQYLSLYAVIADKSNPKRQLYFPTISEKLMWFFLEVLYKGQPTSDDLADLCTISASNILAGYCFRTTEEALAASKNCEIEMREVSKLIEKHQEDEKKEMGQDYQYYLWKDADLNNSIIRRFVFLDALRKNNYYQKFLLFEKSEIVKCMYPCIEGIRKSAIENLERAFTRTYKSEQKAKYKVQQKRALYEEEAGNDFIIGYCLRLSESLMPYVKEPG